MKCLPAKASGYSCPAGYAGAVMPFEKWENQIDHAIPPIFTLIVVGRDLGSAKLVAKE